MPLRLDVYQDLRINPSTRNKIYNQNKNTSLGEQYVTIFV